MTGIRYYQLINETIKKKELGGCIKHSAYVDCGVLNTNKSVAMYQECGSSWFLKFAQNLTGCKNPYCHLHQHHVHKVKASCKDSRA